MAAELNKGKQMQSLKDKKILLFDQPFLTIHVTNVVTRPASAVD